MNFIDKLISFVSPSLALKRQINLFRLQYLERSYEGATRGRRGEGWGNINSSDPNVDLSRDLPTLVERSSHLYKNNPYGKKAVKAIALNVVGTGIMPAPKSKSATAKKAAKEAWADWAETKQCDFYGRGNIYALQMRAMRNVAIKGEVLVIKRRVKDTKGLPIKLQLLSCDRIDNSKNSLVDKGSSYTANGIEYDSDGVVSAYWIYDVPPTNLNNIKIESKRIPAKDVLHVYDEELIGQGRGVPFLTASMLRFRDFDDLEDAKLMQNKVAACYSAFVTEAPNPSPVAVSDAQKLEDERLEPGMIKKLQPGESVAFATPNSTEGYSEYARKVQQGMAAGAGVTYEQLSGDLSNVNFSSGRMGWIEAMKQIEDWQFNMFIPLFCDGVWDWFVDACKIAGKLKESDVVLAEWTPPGRQMIDPSKETKGIETALSLGIKSWSETVRQSGYDPDVLLQEMRDDKIKLESLGIPFEWLMGKQAPAAPKNGTKE